MLKNFFVFVFELLKIVVISLFIIIPIRYFLIQPFYVKGASMEPSFYDHEYLIVDEISYRFNKPSRGDIIVFRYPRNPQEYFIKRLIGLPGEQIQVKDGEVKIFNNLNRDGFVLNEDYLPDNLKTYGLSEEKVTLSQLDENDPTTKNEYFVLGDNRNSSKDSRSFGPVAESFITGKVLLRGWPFDRIQFFDDTIYSH